MNKERPITHVAFSDESHWNKGRYRSLGLVTLPRESLAELERSLARLLDESGVSEFKWEKLSGARERFAAIKMCEFVVDAACQGSLRLDVLVWDIEDSRHKVPQRDDVANLQRMYYHLFKYVLRTRWPDGSIWALYPDENTAMDWDSVRDYLDRADTEIEVYRDLFTGGKFRLRLIREFQIYEIKPVSSACNPLLQLADLFAGLAVFSREHYDALAQWRRERETQLTLFASEDSEDGDGLGGTKTVSRSIRERCYVLDHFDKLCKSRKLGVSLKTERGLRTFDHRKPINFWPYTPQHPLDKAPTKR